ncbi:hypothetical protein OZ410_13160, partial [Robiginitalea sp. M366]|uniref:hypothetical protein n=1 Tax=Robiginitalea aestuariiviva TaxID=3036903 RepID=UPI00240D9A06
MAFFISGPRQKLAFVSGEEMKKPQSAALLALLEHHPPVLDHAALRGVIQRSVSKSEMKKPQSAALLALLEHHPPVLDHAA